MTPPPIVVLKERVASVWVDAQRLYWLTAGPAEFTNLYSCLKLDCAHTKVTYEELIGTSRGVAVDGKYIFWASWNADISACPVDGCGSRPVTITQDPALNHRIFADREYVYWSSDLDLYRCPASGCAATPEVVSLSGITDHLAFDETRAYWLGQTGIFSAPKDGSEPPRVVIELEPLGEDVTFDRNRDLAVGGDYVYWATQRQIFRCPVASCMSTGPTLLVSASAAISDLKLDATAIYWLESDTVHSCPLTGCESSSVLTPQVASAFYLYAPARYAVDESDLYWIEPSTPTGEQDGWGGPVRRTPK